jgi:hypothetical protein
MADRLCRDKPFDPNRNAVLVALGDSVTSAHWQKENGISPCDANNSSDDRGLRGNDMNFSYAGRVYAKNPNITEYYNFARTGFGTDHVLRARDTTKDTCDNKWDRVDTPLALAEKAIKAAKKANKEANVVLTAGINNTNWVDVIKDLTACRAMEAAFPFIQGMRRVSPKSSFRYFAEVRQGEPQGFGQRKHLIERPGGCQMVIWEYEFNLLTRQVEEVMRNPIRMVVRPYDGPGSSYLTVRSAAIAGDARLIVQSLLNAGADQVIWLLYYDITVARIDIDRILDDISVRFVPFAVIRSLLLLHNIGKVPLIDVPHWDVAKNYVTLLNREIRSGLPNNRQVVPFSTERLLGRGSLQETAMFGSPHPNEEGHDTLRLFLKPYLGGH